MECDRVPLRNRRRSRYMLEGTLWTEEGYPRCYHRFQHRDTVVGRTHEGTRQSTGGKERKTRGEVGIQCTVGPR